MSDDDITETVLTGDAYERAAVTTRRMIGLSLVEKVRMAIVFLAVSTTLAPMVSYRRELIRTVEGTETVAPAFALLALNGLVVTFVGGVVLVRQSRVRPQDESHARKLIRIEDFLAVLVISGGLFILTAVTLAVVGLVSPGTVETLAESGVRLYRPAGTAVADSRLVSGVGGLLALALFVLWRTLGRTAHL